MAREPENMTLRLLRDIRAQQDEIKAKLVEQEQQFQLVNQRFDAGDRRLEEFRQQVAARFDEVDERFDELRDVVTHNFGLAGANEVKLRQHNARLREADQWRQRTEESIAALERRVGKLEEPGAG